MILDKTNIALNFHFFFDNVYYRYIKSNLGLLIINSMYYLLNNNVFEVIIKKVLPE